MRILETVAVAFGMYSALPMPSFPWNQDNMRHALAAFPLVGAVVGLFCWAWTALCGAFAVPPLLRGAGLCVLPALVTGGIHLDGYCDTADALASHGSPERKREILHDAHCGAFACIRLCVYYVVSFALFCTLAPSPSALWCLGFFFVLSRCLSGAALCMLQLAPGSSLAKSFADAADKRRTCTILLLTAAGCLVGLFCFGGWLLFLAAIGITAVAAFCCGRTALREFGGISGDLAGWFLVKEEFWLLAALTAVQLGGRGL